MVFDLLAAEGFEVIPGGCHPWSSHKFKELFERSCANDIVGKIMKIEEYNRAVAMIKENSRGVNIATSQLLLGPNNFGLNVQIGEKERNCFLKTLKENSWMRMEPVGKIND